MSTSLPPFQTLDQAITRSVAQHSEFSCIKVAGHSYSYREVGKHIDSISNCLGNNMATRSDFIAVFGVKSLHTYTGIFAILCSGYGYLPLNPAFPASRLKTMLTTADCNTIILCEECIDAFQELAPEFENLTIVCPEAGERLKALGDVWKQHSFLFPGEIPTGKDKPGRTVTPDSPAYLLYTSGSTGTPKGVVVSHGNVCSYLSYTIDRYGINSNDRISQMFDITFDLSIHDIFVSVLSGACLCVPPRSAVMAPAKFIKENEITLWFSVPSLVMFMNRLRMLKPCCFPSIRYSLFCGEALTRQSAQAWQSAASNSIVENLYGPTEATIAITNYVWDNALSPDECVNDVVPIGFVFKTQKAIAVSPDGEKCAAGQKGELCLCGSQVTRGYLNNPQATEAKFVIFGHSDELWYRTGDLVVENGEGCFFFLGRLDDQIQLRGFRVELQEIDKALRTAAATDLAICAPDQPENGQVESITGYVQGNENDFSRKNIINTCKSLLPDYMVPAKIAFIDQLPLNANGKINRKMLTQNLSKQ